MKSIDVNTKMTLMLELSEKDFKEVILKIFHWTIKKMMETNEKKKKVSTKKQSLSKEKESQQKINKRYKELK